MASDEDVRIGGSGMNRRAFTKLVGVAVLAPSLPVPVAPKPMVVGELRRLNGVHWISEKSHVGFDPRQRYMNALVVNKAMPKMRQLLRANMEKTVPPAYRKKVTWHDKPFDLGRRLGIGWMYNPEEAV